MKWVQYFIGNNFDVSAFQVQFPDVVFQRRSNFLSINISELTEQKQQEIEDYIYA